MIALFQNVDEIREHCSFIGANTVFSKVSGQLEYESEEIRQLIGNDTYSRALAHYQSQDYNNVNEQDATLQVLNRLVYLIQAPVANFAYLAFAPHNDINHTGNGRQIHISEDSKPAFEWQIVRSEEALHRTAHKQVDHLLQYLEENSLIITEWKDSDERKQNFDLFLSSASQLDRIYPIDRSRWLYTKLSSFLREYQEDTILPLLGAERYDALKSAVLGPDNLDDDQQKLITMIRKPMALYAVALGLKRLSLKFFPDGIVQGYKGERTNVKASQVATEGVRYRLAQELLADAEAYEKVLNNHVTSLQTASDEIPGTLSDLDLGEDLDDPGSEPFFSS